MIQFNNALLKVLKNTFSVRKEIVKIEDLLGCVLAEDIITKYDVPFFDNSAVDGFSVRMSDINNALPLRLKLVARVRAGDSPKIRIPSGSTVKILTGAPIPKGVDGVVMQEFTEEKNGEVIINRLVQRGENIREKGEEFKKGCKVLLRGVRITPPVVGLLATLGYKKCVVYKKPKVSIIVTGNELVKPGKKLKPGKIYESNSFALLACLKEIGIKNYKVVAVRDNKKLIRNQVSNALKTSDVIITVGGISVGDYDFVEEVVSSLGVRTIYTKIAMKPGKPNYFGIYKKDKKKKLVFGLPGNPVSALMSFHQIIKPALLKMMGVGDITPLQISGILASNLKKKAGRVEFVRGIVKQKNGSLTASPTTGQGSHMMGGIATANCVIYFPKEKKYLSRGEKVNLELLSWS